ncbi:DUF1853 family protein [Algibacter mikhailovii]|uniref:DUF1853 family protein n=1 Tax=Algibacter mikhailovii TaxID=425498 RepID=UPI002494C20D|nr:DUF1853 family protein [Algibacter mikhailovii]
MIRNRYEGFLDTPYLWHNDAVFGLTQLELKSIPFQPNFNIENNLRLGKYVERLVSFELKQQDNISVLAENIQVQQEKRTMGELDCILMLNNQPIHLEIIYKFYLYDATVGETEIDHFIGPNRKDSLTEKLVKLKHKQLPLLYSDSCKPYLKNLGVSSKNMQQRVYFKAQLFLPFNNTKHVLHTLNNDCIVGYYVNTYDLDQFTDCKFYIPKKIDWLLIPHPNVNWQSFIEFKTTIKGFFEQQYSSLLWVKFKNGVIKKIFLVWW